MVKKIFGMIALAAFIATTAFSAVNATMQQDTIWVYDNDGTTTDAPHCNELIEDICAREYEVFPGTEIPDMSKPTGEVRQGQRIL